MPDRRPSNASPPDAAPASGRRRRLLMVTGIFPPIATVGVVRSVKFCKYIREQGWDVEVLAYRPRPGRDNLDDRTLATIPPDVIVHRTPWIDPVQSVQGIRRMLGRAPAGARMRGEASDSEISSNNGADPKAGRLGRLIRGLPDKIAPWIPFGVLGGWRAALRCDCIYSSSPPFSTNVVASWLHRLSGKPWIADFRDPWIGNQALDPVHPLHERWHRRWERHVIRRSEFAINVTAPLHDRLVARYPDEPPDKFVTIFNGIDMEELPTDWPRIERTTPSEPLVFGYFGTLYNSRSPVPLFKAVRALLDAGTVEVGDLRVRIVGVRRENFEAEIAQYGLGEIVEMPGKVPHEQVIREMGQTGVLLQIGAADMDVHSLSTKIFEYLAARRPILALVPEGPIAEIVRTMNAGTVVPPARSDGIAEAIAALLAEHRRAGLPLNPPCDLSPFTRRAQAGQLVELLNRAVESPRSKRR